MRTVTAYGVTRPHGSFEKLAIERRALGPHDVLIKIAFAGICHSDIHTVRGEWGSIAYPMVPGHEIAGVIEEVGDAVDHLAVGERAGVGCFVDSCRECANCLAGEDSYCTRGTTATYNGVDKQGLATAGGYSTHIVVDERYTLKIPDELSLAEAAPLLCAGITMYSPLRHWGAGPGKNVGIVGLGGLGHMGVKIASAMGADVSIFTRSDAKRADAARLGATSFTAPADRDTLKPKRYTMDLIINTISGGVDVETYLALLRLNGTLVNVGVSPEPYTVRFGPLVGGRRSLAASGIGGIRETQEMLDFCAAHGLGADIEVISAQEIDVAYDRVVSSDVRYRFVIDAATF
jgi:uncharacterized zinc-type alcohol dehydrogenase-like protein